MCRVRSVRPAALVVGRFLASRLLASSPFRAVMQAAEVCRHYGTPAGCRRGKRCQLLHVNDDGSHGKTKASPPETEEGHADRFRNLVLTMMRDRLRQQGSSTEILGASFRQGAELVRFTVRTAHRPSEASYLVDAGSVSGRFRGKGNFHVEPMRIGADPVFFHGTTVLNGLENDDWENSWGKWT